MDCGKTQTATKTAKDSGENKMTSESAWADALHKVCGERDALKAELKEAKLTALAASGQAHDAAAALLDDQWRPIETAPLNWPVLVFAPGTDRSCYRDVCLTFENGARKEWQASKPRLQPTHWMPLPKPPKENAK